MALVSTGTNSTKTRRKRREANPGGRKRSLRSCQAEEAQIETFSSYRTHIRGVWRDRRKGIKSYDSQLRILVSVDLLTYWSS
jgi:hypothetical protein